jgi:hypothetical protein
MFAILLALLISGIVVPSAYSQSESKTGAGPRGTPVAPSTEPSQAEAPRPPPGMDRSGTPVANGNSQSMSQSDHNSRHAGSDNK